MGNLRQAAARAARANGIPVPLFLRLIGVESGWRPQIVSSAGAVGLTQLMPGTARELGVDPMNPGQNLNGGARYLRSMFNKFGSWPLALAAYNAGAGAVEQHGGIPPYPETHHYVSMIMGGLKAGAKTMQTPTAPPMMQPQQPENFSAFGPDLAGVGMQNLSEGADPLRSLENLTSEVAYSRNMGVPEPASPMPGQPLGVAPRGSQAGFSTSRGHAGGFLPTGASFSYNRHDQGRDIQTSPGTPIVAPGDGYVVRIASDPGGGGAHFGPSYPIVFFTSGPYKGRYVYIGHTVAAVRPGQRFQAGSVLSHTQHSGPNNGGAPSGWAEIGFAPGGTPGAFNQPAPF